MHGILRINKPSGITSHDVVHKIKKQFKLSNVGHAGTLDPMATGLLILLVGNATKLAFLFENLDKVYEGEMVFGQKYDTDDMTGHVLATKEARLTIEEIKEKSRFFLPGYHQVPPQFSAIKKQGKKAYQLSRKGIEVNLDSRWVHIYAFEALSYNDTLTFKAHVSKGTYIRSLARDLGEKLGTFGALSRLNRVQVGLYHVKDAKSIEEVNEKDLIPDTTLFKQVRHVQLNDYMIRLVQNGVYLDERNVDGQEPLIIQDQKGQLIAYYIFDEGKFKPKYFFRG